MPSELNRLLLKLEATLADHEICSENRRKVAADLLAAIDAKFTDPDFEVTRDLFDGVSNDFRRLVVAGFVAHVSTALQVYSAAAEAGERLADTAEHIESAVGKPPGVPPPKPAKGKGSPPPGSLDDLLRRQNRRLN